MFFGPISLSRSPFVKYGTIEKLVAKKKHFQILKCKNTKEHCFVVLDIELKQITRFLTLF